MEKAANGSYLLSWEVIDETDVKYLVFSRKAAGGQFDFTNPAASIADNTWQTPSLTFENSTCYLVRFTKAGVQSDSNTKELCSSDDAYVFKGISALTLNTDGTYLLSWDEVPTSSQVSYKIYSTNKAGKYDFTTPLDSVSKGSYKTAVYPIDQNQCFVVRFVLPEHSDTNVAELCSKTSILSDFVGIAAVASPDTGVAEISWVKSTNTTVAGYRVYVGTDFKTQVASVSADKSTASISGLAIDSSQNFGVRAFDQYGREDSNTKTASVTVSNFFLNSVSVVLYDRITHFMEPVLLVNCFRT